MGKKQTKSQAKVKAAFHEVYHNTPGIVAVTTLKKGPKQAHKQRVAIALDKARRAGARGIRKGAPRGK